MYRKRHAESVVKKLSEMFGAVLVAGPRQVGKTTMLKALTKDIGYVTLDDMIVFVDEIQKAPVLFEQIKMYIDRDRKKGQFYMCGSQQFRMMKGVSESLSGRIGLLTLLGYSLREMYRIDFDLPFFPTEDYFAKRRTCLKNMEYGDVWKIIHRGSMPELCENPEYDWQMFYGAYLRTYIERDVSDLAEIGDSIKFSKFMVAVAAMSGNLLNKASLARDVGISEPTAERWLSILVASNIVYLLQPYSNNITKRAIKTPKV